MPESQQKESQNRINSIIALMREEAKTVLPGKKLSEKTRLYHVLTNVNVQITKIMRTLE